LQVVEAEYYIQWKRPDMSVWFDHGTSAGSPDEAKAELNALRETFPTALEFRVAVKQTHVTHEIMDW